MERVKIVKELRINPSVEFPIEKYKPELMEVMLLRHEMDAWKPYFKNWQYPA
jgi:hypothetical protein